MKIYLIQDDKNFRYLSVDIFFPTFKIGYKALNGFFDENHQGFKISFPTEIYYINDREGYKVFCLTFLGFGFRINKQDGY